MFIILDRRGTYSWDGSINRSTTADEIARSHMAMSSELMVTVHNVYTSIVITYSGKEKGSSLIDINSD